MEWCQHQDIHVANAKKHSCTYETTMIMVAAILESLTQAHAISFKSNGTLLDPMRWLSTTPDVFLSWIT